jgi:single-stranded-DNA-specific exonuclease
MDGETGRGSARSIPAFPLHSVLTECRDCLLEFGGHAQAAGIRIHQKELERFREVFNERALEILSPDDMMPSFTIDAEVILPSLTKYLIEDIERMAPFGEGNRPPVFATTDLRIAGAPRRMGREGQHLSFNVAQDGTCFRTVGFGMGHLYDRIADRAVQYCSLAYIPRLNRWRGQENIELEIVDVQPLKY